MADNKPPSVPFTPLQKPLAPTPSVNVNTAAGQVKLAETAKVGSQPSSNKPLEPQVQGQSSTIAIIEQNGVKVESVKANADGSLDFTRPLTEDEILTNPNIQARSFDYSGDEVKVLPINSNYILRWVQCGDYRGAGTNWLAKQMARGFEYATIEDLRPEYKEKYKLDGSRIVIPPDLVLMKMRADIYYGYIKGNMLESLDRVSRKGAVERARVQAIEDMHQGGKNDKGNIAPGIPNFGNDLSKHGAGFYDPLAGR